MTTVINIKLTPPPTDGTYFYCGRGSKYGNPFTVATWGRGVAVTRYREFLHAHPGLVEAARLELKDKVLGCYCHPQPCHVHILARIANGGEI